MNELIFNRTDSLNPDFIHLNTLLDKYLAVKDGDEHAFYAQYNKIDTINHVLLAYENGIAVACGAIREFDSNTMEIKRMFTLVEHRNKGLASKMLMELEKWTKDLGYNKCILETGKRQTEAAALYPKRGYKLITNYGQYKDMENSLCFEKLI